MPTPNGENLKKKNVDDKEKTVTIIYEREFYYHIKTYKRDNTRGWQSVPNVNIPETETIKLVRTYQEKRRRQPIKTNDGHCRTGEEKKGAA